MNMTTKKSIFEEHLEAWLEAKRNRKKRGAITNHICFVTGMHRNSVSRKFRALQMRNPLRTDQRGRAVYYTPDAIAALKDVWEAGDEACGEILHPQIREYVEILRRDKMWRHGNEATAKLLAMSERTVKRRVCEFERARGSRKGLSSTKPSALKSIIPIFKGPWRELPPGHEQIDTVAHCGSTLLGDFVYSLSAIDAAAYWTNIRAQWNKGEEATLASVEYIERQMPSTTLSRHSDSGSEFLNYYFLGETQKSHIDQTRSRSGKKNDNAFIEERNGHIVRKWIGYDRFDTEAHVVALNAVYEKLDLFLNHFQAVRRCVKRERIGSKYVRVYDAPQTPYARALAHRKISKLQKEKLRTQHATLNPVTLLKEIATLKEALSDVN